MFQCCSKLWFAGMLPRAAGKKGRTLLSFELARRGQGVPHLTVFTLKLVLWYVSRQLNMHVLQVARLCSSVQGLKFYPMMQMIIRSSRKAFYKYRYWWGSFADLVESANNWAFYVQKWGVPCLDPTSLSWVTQITITKDSSSDYTVGRPLLGRESANHEMRPNC